MTLASSCLSNSMSPSVTSKARSGVRELRIPGRLSETRSSSKIDVRGKIMLVRYGQNFRGVKAFVAQEHGAAGVLLYSDPADDGWRHGDKYPQGPWRPDTGVQRGSIGYNVPVPGDPTTPGIASVPSLPDANHVARSVSAAPKNSHNTDLLRRTPGRSSSTWAAQTRRGSGKVRCPSPTTSDPGRQK